MTQRPEESPEQSRQLDLYDYRFLLWAGESPERARARVGISEPSIRRWTDERSRFLGRRRLLRLPYGKIIRPLDSSQVRA